MRYARSTIQALTTPFRPGRGRHRYPAPDRTQSVRTFRPSLVRSVLALLLVAVTGLGLAVPQASAAAIDCPVGNYCGSAPHRYPDGRALSVDWHRHNASGSQLSVDFIVGVLQPSDNAVVTSVFVVSDGKTVANTLATHNPYPNSILRSLDNDARVGVLIANTPNSYVGWRACYADGRCIQHTLSTQDWVRAN